MRLLAKAVTGVVVGLGGLVASCAGAIASSASTQALAPSALATNVVPAQLLGIDEAAAATCPGLSWTVLAAINEVESSDGTSTLPGVSSGANFAGAEGPMQFEPATFAAYAYPVPSGGASPPSPYDATDAIYAAARDLCANGGGQSGWHQRSGLRLQPLCGVREPGPGPRRHLWDRGLDPGAASRPIGRS